jgi:uncharacterized protein with HEPN domain
MAQRPTIASTIAQIRDYIDEFERIAAAPPLPGDDIFARSRELALERLALNISEATTRIPDEEKHKAPEIPWRAITDMGNRLRHDYDNVAAEAVLELTDKPHLRELRAALDKLDPDALQTRRYQRKPRPQS